VTGIVAVASTIFSQLLHRNKFETTEDTPMKKSTIVSRLFATSLFETVASVAAIAVGDTLLA
jgi:hypothetical protein